MDCDDGRDDGGALTLASSPKVPVKGAVANHPIRNGNAVPKTSPRNIPSPWFPRPIAAKVMMARTSPAASLRLLIVASSTSPSTFATPWKASLLRCSTGITLIPDGGAFASGPEPIGPGLGGAASGSRRLNLPLVSTTGSFSEARGAVVTRGWAIRRVREPGRAERSARAPNGRAKEVTKDMSPGLEVRASLDKNLSFSATTDASQPDFSRHVDHCQWHRLGFTSTMRTSDVMRKAARVVSDLVSHAPSARGGAAAPSKGIKVINITPYAASKVAGGGGVPHAHAGVSAQTKPAQLDRHWVNAFHKIHTRGYASSFTARMAATLSPKDVKKRMDEINDNFTEAREEIEAAMEAVGTTYFNEEAEYAKEVTEKTLGT